MKDFEEQDKSICRNCFHSYVCEQFNEHRDSDNKKCHFHNDHFFPAADVAEEKRGRWIENEDDFWVLCDACGVELWDKDGKIVEQYQYCPYCGAFMFGKGENDG